MLEGLVRISRVAVIGLAALQLMTSVAAAQYYGGEARHGTGIVTEAGIVIVAATDVN